VLWSLPGITDSLAALFGKTDNNTVIGPFWALASMERQQLLTSHLGKFMFRFVDDIYFSNIGSLDWEKLQQRVPCDTLIMSVNRVSMIFSFPSWLIYVPIGCRHPFINYWLPLLAKTIAKCSLPHPENQLQWSVNSFSCCIFWNQVIALIFAFITEFFTAIIGKNTTYPR